MASLRLTFPEKDEPTVIALTGARLTIGRLPFNTIQIIDRTVSGFHAELISEHGHYRLHDRGSSNGTFVNGQKVSDFHLTESCSITFGTVEAQFSPEAVAATEEAESFPTRTEINSVRKENVELKATVAALREEANALRLARPMESGDAALAVTKEEFDKVVVEREVLKEERLKQDEELARLKTDLAVLKRDRVNLQLAYDGLQREVTDLRAKAGGIEEVAIQPKAAAAALAAQAPDPGVEVRVDVPALVTGKTSLIPSPYKRPEPASQPATEKAPAAPTAPASPVAPSSQPSVPSYTKPPTAVPKSPSAPTPGTMKPFAPLPKAPGLAGAKPGAPVATPAPAAAAAATPAPTAAATTPPPSAVATPPPTAKIPVTPTPAATPASTPASAPGAAAKPVVKAPVGLGNSGFKPLSKPPGPLGVPAQNKAAETSTPTPSAAPASPKPSPTIKLPSQPTIKLPAVPAPAPVVGPKGTQKL
jgi:pSer/pThr/pTyr-binding forkhead associated (FHA) protein